MCVGCVTKKVFTWDGDWNWEGGAALGGGGVSRGRGRSMGSSLSCCVWAASRVAVYTPEKEGTNK